MSITLEPMGSDRLLLFLKAPRLGEVKTRLAQSLGDEGALRAYEQLVATLVRRLGGLTDVEVRYAPDDAAAEIAPWLRPAWHARPQGSGDLGRRLRRAFAEAFREGADRVVAIGSDCPWVGVSDIEAAWGELEVSDVVLGPTPDGGYWLVGLRGSHLQIFDGIPWSTPEVFSETLKRVRSLGLRYRLLRELMDVDTEQEWRIFQSQADVNRSSGSAPRDNDHLGD